MSLVCPKCDSENVQRRGTTSAGMVRIVCNDCTKWSTLVPQSTGVFPVPTLTKSRFVVTAAQNSTSVDLGFLTALESYCGANDAQLLVIPYRYKNPTSRTEDEEDDWWDHRIFKYLMDARQVVCEGLVILGDIKIQPTAVTPLSGLEGFTGEASAVVAHPKIQLVTVPTRQGKVPKVLMTTGAITEENYSDSKAGKKGEHHHSLAATIVEIAESGKYHLRHIHWSDDRFYDLNKCYHSGGFYEPASIEALVVGDLHEWWIDKDFERGVFAEGGLIDSLSPRQVILHDVCDSYSISHHHSKKPFTQLAKFFSGRNSLLEELQSLLAFFELYQRPGVQFLIVPSNHDDHIRRWVEDSDWKTQPWNAELYLEMALEMVRHTHMTKEGAATLSPFKWWLESHTQVVKVLDGPYEIAGIELGMHGDQGPNGARGSVIGFSKLGCKVVVGHMHSPAIRDGAYVVGTATGEMEYSKGKPSSWMNTCAIIYPDGKRTLINIIEGEYTTYE